MEQSQQDRRAEILEAAGAEFMEKGFEAATTLAIARRAHISKRDLYAMFGSKRGVLDALISFYAQNMTLPADLPAPSSREVFFRTLEAFGSALLAQLLDDRRVAFYRLAIAEAQRSTDFAQALATQGEERVRISVETFVAGAVMRGLIPAQDASLAMECFFGMLLGNLPLAVIMGVTPAPDQSGIAERSSRAAEAARRIVGGG